MRTPTVPAVPVGGRRWDWLDHAACRGYDRELFFSVTEIRAARVQVEEAKKVCRRCPVQLACLSWALGNRQEAGIWGGMTEEERHRLRRRRLTPG